MTPEKNNRDKERADSEGMGTAIGNPSSWRRAQDQDLLAMPEFLQTVIERFRREESLSTIEDAAESLFEELEGLEEFEEAFEGEGHERLRRHMRAFLGDEEWQKVLDAETERSVFIDKTVGGTPG